MPRIWPITALGFPGLFNDLGIQAVPAGPNWWLSDTVLPVTLVNTQIGIIGEGQGTRFDPVNTFDAVAIGSADGDVIVDTTGLPVGVYDVRLALAVASTVDQRRIELQLRNAANSANIWRHAILITLSDARAITWDFAFSLVGNERIRVQVGGGAMGVADTISALLMARLRT